MASIFRKDDQYVDKPKRNVFPKSFESNVTTKFGKIIPVFCKPVMIGETMKIQPKMNFNFLPLVFPVQNRVRASLSFYYVRNRNLWKDWMDFQFKMADGLVPPYHVFREETYREMLKVGGLLDNLGVPTVLHGNYTVQLSRIFPKYDLLDKMVYDPYTDSFQASSVFHGFDMEKFGNVVNGSNDTFRVANWYDSFVDEIDPEYVRNVCIFRKPLSVVGNSIGVYNKGQVPDYIYFICGCESTATTTISERLGETIPNAAVRGGNGMTKRGPTQTATRDEDAGLERQTDVVTTKEIEGFITEYKIIGVPSDSWDWEGTSINVIDFPAGLHVKEIVGYFTSEYGLDGDSYNTYDIRVSVNVEKEFGNVGLPLSEIALESLPFPHYSDGQLIDGENYLHISSLPARAIKAIYNSHIRNEANNPFMVNGRPEYNKYIDNDEGGADSDFYPLYYRNWQDDCFTTALHTPQHGQAPLVGLVNNGGDVPYIVTFKNDDGTTNSVTFKNYGGSEIEVDVDRGDAPEGADSGYVGQLKEAMIEAVRFGININDFRNVNSFQRWLEANCRKGYKYRDQIKAHNGVSVKYDILDMPEYIGGMSRDMNVMQVTQTTENAYGNLGDFSGQAWIEGEMNHSISHFCDEEGFIIGLLSVQPIAPYSQVLPKYLLRESAFDYYSPEFGKIGMQPILNREIAPLQSFYERNGLEVFGYQRAWYDSLDGLSEVHGKFRTDFRNFIINRTFDSVPKLGEDFLVMSDDDINNIFYVDNDEDKILGQLYFEYDSILPIPQYGVPALE